MQQRTIRVELTKQLLVEGSDEALLFPRFLQHLEIASVQVQNYQGKDNLGNFLRDIIDTIGFDDVESMRIVRDADTNANSALQSVQSHLQNAGLSVPRNLLTSVGQSPRVSIFIMPDNSGIGALEDLCLAALVDDPATHCVTDFIQCVNETVATPPQNQAKARMHAFLASREDPELRLGEAAQRGYIPMEHPAFTDLAQFLRNL